VATTSVTFTINSAPQTVTWSPTTELTVEQSPVTGVHSPGDGGSADGIRRIRPGNCHV
jgi:hypothetical protein